MFCGPFGQPLDGRHLTSRIFRGLLRGAGLPPIRFHDLRHTPAMHEQASVTIERVLAGA